MSHGRFAVELGVVIGKPGRDIQEAQADSHIAGYGAFSLTVKINTEIEPPV